MKIRKLSLLTAVLASVLLVPAGCGPDDPDTPWNEAATTYTTVSTAAVAGQGGTLLYDGREQTGTIRVPENALMGVVRDGKAYLYHPALGQDVQLSDETSRQALALFIMGRLEADAAAGLSAAADDTATTLGPGDAATTPTGVRIRRGRLTNNGKIILNVENKYNRWVGLRFADGKTSLIPPAGRSFDSNLCRWLNANDYGWLVQEVWPEDDNPYAAFASTDTAVVETASAGDVDIVGATWRAAPYQWVAGRSPPGLAEARATGKFFELVNIMDLYYVLLEGVKHIGGAAIPLECFDIAFGTFANWLEANSLAIASGDTSIREQFYRVLTEDYYNSLVNCKGVVASVGIWEVIQTAVDLIALFDWFVEDIYLNAPFIYSLPAYGRVRLASDNPCDALAVMSLRAGEVEITGNFPSSQWCEADVYVANNSAERDIYVIYTRDGTTWDFKRGLTSLPNTVQAGSEEPIINAYTYYWPQGGTCSESGVKAIAAFYVPTLLDGACSDEHDYVLDNHALPPGITAVDVDDANSCECPMLVK